MAEYVTLEQDSIISTQYRLVKFLGEGGMGVVWLARDLGLDRDIAIKFLGSDHDWSSESKKRFKRGVDVQCKLHHENIVQIFGGGTKAYRPFVVMEYCSNGDLAHNLEAYDDQARLRFITSMLLGLSYAHKHNVVHRDVTLSNLLLDEGSRLKIADFGLAKVLEGASERITRDRKMLGTQRYIAPEQLNNSEFATLRSDVYSAGVVIADLLLSHPWNPADSDSSFANQLEGRFDLVPEMLGIVRRSTSSLPGDRYASAIDLCISWQQLFPSLS